MAAEDDIARALENLNRNISRAFGGSSDSFLGARAAGGATPAAGGGGVNAMNMLSAAASGVVGSMKVLHGSTDDLTHLFRRMVGFGVAGEIFDHIIDSGRRLVTSYNKMTDIGQHFGGSMFSMAQAAGASGLSLEEFSKAMERNSITAASMQTHAGGATNAFAQMQLGVRDSLKQFGFYGMTLTQLTDTTGDFMDSLRHAGLLTKMTTKEQQSYVSSMITAATGFSAAFGKSREEILKNAKEALQNAGAVSQLQTKEQQEAYSRAVLGLSSLGEAGKALSESFGKIVSSPLGTLDPKNGLMSQFTSMGMQNLFPMFEDLKRTVLAGGAVSPEKMGDILQRLQTELNNPDRLKSLRLQTTGPNAEAANAMLQLRMQLQGLTREQLITKYAEAIKGSTDMITKAALLFESQFHEITGAFRSGFYRGIVRGLTPDPTKSGSGKDMEATMKSFKDSLEKLGEGFGTLLTTVFTPERIEKFTSGAVEFMTFIGEKIPMVLGWLGTAFTTVRDTIQNIFGVSKGTADIMTIGAALLFKKLASFFLKMYVQKAAFYISSATGLGGTAGALPVGGGGAAGRGAGRFLGGGGKALIKGGLIAGLVAFGAETLLNSFGQFKGKDSISAALTGAGLGATVGGLFGPIGMVVGGILGAVGGLIYENFDDLKEGNFKKIFSELGDFASTALKFVGGILGSIWTSITSITAEDVIGALDKVVTLYGQALSLEFSMISSVLKWIWTKVTSISAEDVMNVGMGIFNGLVAVGKIELHIISGVLKWLGDSIIATAKELPSIIKTVFNGIVAWDSWLLDLVKGLMRYIIGGITSISIPDTIKKFFGFGSATDSPAQSKTANIDYESLNAALKKDVDTSGSADLGRKKARDQALIDADQARLADATDPASQAAINAEIVKLMAELVQINKAQAIIQKKNLDATQDLNLYPMPVL